MIIFYDKKTGKIKGTVDGRIHGQEHAKIWIGDKKETGRIIIQWKPVGKIKKIIKRKVKVKDVINGNGFYKPVFKEVKKEIETTEFTPDTEEKEQKEIFKELDKNPMKVYDFIVDISTKKLVKK